MACAFSGSESNFLISSSFGEVNGWCAATYLFASSSYSSNGQSVTHKKFSFVSSIKPSSFASLIRSAPRLCATTLGLSATNITKSPGSAPVNSVNVATLASSKNRAIGPLNPSSTTLTQANPLAPYILTNSVNPSISLRV